MSDERFVHAWLLRLDPAWRRLSAAERRADIDAFCAAASRADDRILQLSYSTVGIRAEGELLLWRMADRIEDVGETAADLLSSGIGRWMAPSLSMIGMAVFASTASSAL